MILLLAALGLACVLIYFLSQARRHDEFRSRLQRYRERRQRARPDQPIDPTFQFDQPPADGEEEKEKGTS